jgi:biotin carboxylase
MPRVLLLLPATTYRAEGFLEAAAGLHLDVTVGAEMPASLAARAPDFLALDLTDAVAASRAVVRFSESHPVHAVIGVDDHTAVVAAVLADVLGLPHNDVEAVAAARNKYRMRELLGRQGLPVPRYAKYSIERDPATIVRHIAFPCVVKPLILASSCGVIRANDEAEFVAAFRRVARLLDDLGLAAAGGSGKELLVEEFIPGQEVALEGLLSDGALRVLALFDKPDPLEGPYFEETIYVTPSRLPAAVQADLAACAGQAARALGLREGPVHGELRVNDRGPWLIEVAARSIGGRCSRTLRFGAGMSLEELILRHALRMDLASLEREQQAAGVMMLPIPRGGVFQEMRGEERALAVPGIEELTISVRPGERLVPLPEGTRYLGFLIARGEAPEEVEAALREAYRRLEFTIGSPQPSSC